MVLEEDGNIDDGNFPLRGGITHQHGTKDAGAELEQSGAEGRPPDLLLIVKKNGGGVELAHRPRNGADRAQDAVGPVAEFAELGADPQSAALVRAEGLHDRAIDRKSVV